MRKIVFILFSFVFTFVFVAGVSAVSENAKGPVDKATGDIWMSLPNQHMIFNAHDVGNSEMDKGMVEYWNFEYNSGILHYSTPILCAAVDSEDNEARFMFRIPEGWPGLTGLYVVSNVTDTGSPGVNNDIYGHTATSDLNTALSLCETGSSYSMYDIVSGNLVVHSY